MTGVVTVETTSRWETSSLLRKLRGYDAYAIQVEPDRWLVLSPVDARDPIAGRAAIEALVAEWTAEEAALRPSDGAGENGDVGRAPE